MTILEQVRNIPSNNRLIDIVSFQAYSDKADQPFLSYRDPNIKGSLSHFTFTDFHTLTNQIANNLKAKINNHYELRYHTTSFSSFKTLGFSTVAFLGNSGLDFSMNLIGLMKLNLTPLILSPRNSLPILRDLIIEGSCKTLVYHKEMKSIALECAEEIEGLNLVEFEDVLSLELDHSIELVPLLDLSVYQDDYSEHIAVIIHSSGSTATPKLNYLSNRYFIAFINNERQSHDISSFLGRGLLCAPLFHVYGLSLFLRGILNSAMIVLKEGHLSAESIVKDIKDFNINFLIMLPYLLKQMVDYTYENPKVWGILSQLKVIQSGGAPIPLKIGQTFKEHQINVQSSFGASEVGCLAYSRIDDNNVNGFNQIELNHLVNYKLTDIEGDTCQVTILKSDPVLASGVVKDGQEGYPIGDVFKIIEHKPDSNYIKLEIVSRANDTIVHLTGEKTNPLPIEQEICNSPYVSKCLVYGRGKLNNCALITVDQEQSAKVPLLKLTQAILNQVEKANIHCPKHSRVIKDLVYILPLNGDKQFVTTAKGNVMRHKTEVLFKDEIEALYNAYENDNSENDGDSFDEGIDMVQYDSQNVVLVLMNQFKKATNSSIKDENASFFQSGLDSLSAVKYRQLIQSKFNKININLNMIYSFDTPLKLSQQILAQLNGGAEMVKDLNYYQKAVDQLVDEFTVPFEEAPSERKEPQELKNVLITGANGSLSGFIIKALLERKDIGAIYCLVRGKSKIDCLQRLLASFRERKIEFNNLQMNQIVALPYVNTSPTLGLDEADYKKIYDEVDIIYHVAWKMDFLLEVEAFRDCIESTRHLLKLSALAPRRPHFNFTSTVGATFPVTHKEIKEISLGTKLSNLSACNGYNLSKLVCEAICEKLTSRYGIALDIFRVGQISGDTLNGVWNTKEHVPLIIKGAQVMKMLPSSLSEDISWIPVDHAGLGMVEIQFNPNNSHNSTISHIVNPSLQSWSTLVEALKSTHIDFTVVSNQTFIKELKENPNYSNVDINPLASLTDFFEGVMSDGTHSFVMNTEKTCLLSESIKSCPKLDANLLIKYVKHWTNTGFLES